MFSRKNESFDKKKSTSLSILGVGMDFTGEINTEGDVHIDGIIKGSIRANQVIIGIDGDFDGEISCASLKINGKIRGKFTINSLHVCSDGLLEGKAKYDEITVDRGGRVQGELSVNKVNIKNNQSKLEVNNDV